MVELNGRSRRSCPTIITNSCYSGEHASRAASSWRNRSIGSIPSETAYVDFIPTRLIESPEDKPRASSHLSARANTWELVFRLQIYFYMAWNALIAFYQDVRAVLSVPTYVTGFSEVEQKNMYCLGPVPRELQFGGLWCSEDRLDREGEQIYILIDEYRLVFNYSLWPVLQPTAGLDDGSEPDSDSLDDYGLPLDCPEDFAGQLKRFNLTQHSVHAVLLLVRLACLAFVRAGDYITPRPKHLTLQHQFVSVPVPTVEQYEVALLQHITKDASEYEVPEWVLELVDPARISGRLALEAARRAGWSHRV